MSSPRVQQPLVGPGPHYWGFTIPLRHTTLCRTPLDEWSARRRDLYLTTNNTHYRQTSLPPGGIRTLNPRKRAATEPSLKMARPPGSVVSFHTFFHFIICRLQPRTFSAWFTVSVNVWLQCIKRVRILHTLHLFFLQFWTLRFATFCKHN
jgi:hypothetical protein